jgi:hypothetical protein
MSRERKSPRRTVYTNKNEPWRIKADKIQAMINEELKRQGIPLPTAEELNPKVIIGNREVYYDNMTLEDFELYRQNPQVAKFVKSNDPMIEEKVKKVITAVNKRLESEEFDEEADNMAQIYFQGEPVGIKEEKKRDIPLTPASHQIEAAVPKAASEAKKEIAHLSEAAAEAGRQMALAVAAGDNEKVEILGKNLQEKVQEVAGIVQSTADKAQAKLLEEMNKDMAKKDLKAAQEKSASIAAIRQASPRKEEVKKRASARRVSDEEEEVEIKVGSKSKVAIPLTKRETVKREEAPVKIPAIGKGLTQPARAISPRRSTPVIVPTSPKQASPRKASPRKSIREEEQKFTVRSSMSDFIAEAYRQAGKVVDFKKFNDARLRNVFKANRKFPVFAKDRKDEKKGEKLTLQDSLLDFIEHYGIVSEKYPTKESINELYSSPRFMTFLFNILITNIPK